MGARKLAQSASDGEVKSMDIPEPVARASAVTSCGPRVIQDQAAGAAICGCARDWRVAALIDFGA